MDHLCLVDAYFCLFCYCREQASLATERFPLYLEGHGLYCDLVLFCWGRHAINPRSTLRIKEIRDQKFWESSGGDTEPLHSLPASAAPADSSGASGSGGPGGPGENHLFRAGRNGTATVNSISSITSRRVARPTAFRFKDGSWRRQWWA